MEKIGSKQIIVASALAFSICFSSQSMSLGVETMMKRQPISESKKEVTNVKILQKIFDSKQMKLLQDYLKNESGKEDDFNSTQEGKISRLTIRKSITGENAIDRMFEGKRSHKGVDIKKNPIRKTIPKGKEVEEFMISFKGSISFKELKPILKELEKLIKPNFYVIQREKYEDKNGGYIGEGKVYILTIVRVKNREIG